MRIFKGFDEARNEIKRDLKEMGIQVQNTHMQDKIGKFPTLELINYAYTVLDPDPAQLEPTKPWALHEWSERLMGILGKKVNPGEAWKTRTDLDWSQFLENDGEPVKDISELVIGPKNFAYTYSERFALADQVRKVIEELKQNPESRQLYISMWNTQQDVNHLGKRRVPCSIGWHLMKREGLIHMTYTMRSCDFFTHWENDVYLAVRLLDHICETTGNIQGHFTQFINSFHVYEKDVAEVF